MARDAGLVRQISISEPLYVGRVLCLPPSHQSDLLIGTENTEGPPESGVGVGGGEGHQNIHSVHWCAPSAHRGTGQAGCDSMPTLRKPHTARNVCSVDNSCISLPGPGTLRLGVSLLNTYERMWLAWYLPGYPSKKQSLGIFYSTYDTTRGWRNNHQLPSQECG